jgi:hypothetical protein
MDRAQRLQEYKRGYARLAATLANLPLEMWQYKTAEQEWSVHEIVMHLVDSEVHISADRGVRCGQPLIALVRPSPGAEVLLQAEARTKKTSCATRNKP